MNKSFTQKLSEWNDNNWKRWEDSWTEIYARHDSNSAKISAIFKKLSAWDDRNCKAIMSLFPKQHYCDGCHNPSHNYSYSKVLQNESYIYGHLHQKQANIETETNHEKFVKFDYEKFETKPVSNSIIDDIKRKSIEHVTNMSAWEKFTGCLKMQKTDKEYWDELHNEMNWINSGVKSIKELFQMDKVVV